MDAETVAENTAPQQEAPEIQEPPKAPEPPKKTITPLTDADIADGKYTSIRHNQDTKSVEYLDRDGDILAIRPMDAVKGI